MTTFKHLEKQIKEFSEKFIKEFGELETIEIYDKLVSSYDKKVLLIKFERKKFLFTIVDYSILVKFFEEVSTKELSFSANFINEFKYEIRKSN